MTTLDDQSPPCANPANGLGYAVTRISRLGSIYLLGSIVPQVVAMLLLPVFTSYLQPEQMGIVTLATRVAGPIGILVQFSLFSGLSRYYFRVEKPLRPGLIRSAQIGQTVVSVATCGLLSIAGIWIAAPLLPNLPLTGECVFYLWLMIVWGCFFNGIVDLAAGTAQLLERARTAVSIGLVNYLGQTGLGVVAVTLLGWQGFGRQSTLFLAAVVAAVVSYRVLWRAGGGTFSAHAFRRIGMSGVTFVPHNMANNLQFALNAWLLNAMASTAALAIYGMALAFAMLIDMPLVALMNAAYPTLAPLMNEGSPEARRQQSRLNSMLAMGIIVLALAVLLLAPVAIAVLTAPAYHAAISLTPVLVLAWLFQGFYNLVLHPLFFFRGGIGLSMASISAVVGSAVLSFLLIPQYGCAGAAWAVVGCFVVKFVVAARLSHRAYPLPWEVSRILRALACGAAFAAVDLCLSPGLSLPLAVLLKVALLLLIAPAFWIVGAVRTEEWRRLQRLAAGAWNTRRLGHNLEPPIERDA
jgi:O-antigen/teichoic acid export membrane protein